MRMGEKLNLHGVNFSYEKKNVAKHRVKLPGNLPLNACECGNILKFHFHKITSADVSSLAI